MQSAFPLISFRVGRVDGLWQRPARMQGERPSHSVASFALSSLGCICLFIDLYVYMCVYIHVFFLKKKQPKARPIYLCVSSQTTRALCDKGSASDVVHNWLSLHGFSFRATLKKGLFNDKIIAPSASRDRSRILLQGKFSLSRDSRPRPISLYICACVLSRSAAL